jgi:aminopeptidase
VVESTQTSPSPVDEGTLDLYADLIVGLGANVQPGQIVEVAADLAKRDLVRAVAAAAYRHGAKFVDANYFDPEVRRARLVYGDPETLDFAPTWATERILQLGEHRCARIALAPRVPMEVFEDLDPAVVAREPFPFLPEYTRIITDSTTNWTGVPCPDDLWARRVYGDAEDALERLWADIIHICRLDEEDPEAAWRARFEELATAERWLNERRFDALHFEGPGTDLTIGLLPGSTWKSGTGETVDGIVHAPNIPTEEVFTGPDPERADGVVATTKPLLLKGGTLVESLVVRFEAGRVVQIEADSGAEGLRQAVATNENGDRLGEVALVDGSSRIGRLDTVFFTTLLDENAVSHIALGNGYPETADAADRGRLNRSALHEDIMIGGSDIDVTGITSDGSRVPVLRRSEWQF